MTPRWIASLLVALLVAPAVASLPAQQEPGRKEGVASTGQERKRIPAGRTDERPQAGTRQKPQEKPQEKIPEKTPEKESAKPRISDLTNPMRAKRVGKQNKGDSESSPETLLRLVPGLGGDALTGLSSSEATLSPDVQMLIRFSRMPGSRAGRRAAVAMRQRNSRFFNLATTGAPTWAEREQRDGRGRITSMRGAGGNRVKFEYDDQGMVRMQAEAVGPHNPKLGDSAGSMRNPQRGGLGTRPVFDNKSFAYRGTKGPRLGTSPLSHYTSSKFDDRTGGRSFTTHDVGGRPSIRIDSKGKITLNRYDSFGRLIGSYDANGKLTIINHDELGRPNFGVDPFGNRAMLDPNRMGGVILGTNNGEIYKGGGNYGQLKPGAPGMLPNPGPTGPVPTLPRSSTTSPTVPTPSGVSTPQQLPPAHQPKSAPKNAR